MNRVQVIDHPLAGNALRTLRNRDSQIKSFREALNSLGLLLAVETCRELEVQKDQVFTPLDTRECSYVDDTRILLVPVLRAGLGFVEFPGFITGSPGSLMGVYRDHDTLEPTVP